MTKEQRIEKIKADLFENEEERHATVLALEQVQSDFYKELYKLDRKSDKLFSRLNELGVNIFDIEWGS